MKVKFNLPTRRYNSSISFDNNTTFGFGNLQPLFCKFVLPKSKFSCNINQLTRLSPLVVPTFARLKQINDFVYVNINKVMPSFDAFLSHTLIKGTVRSYTPNSLPCTTNYDLFCDLISQYAWLNSKNLGTKAITPSFYQETLTGEYILRSTSSKVVSASVLDTMKVDFQFATVAADGSTPVNTFIKLTQIGRYWYTLLRGLGYSLDPNDTKPISILPLWAFAKAYYDLYYPKRYNPWHASNYYGDINSHYNGDFLVYTYKGSSYDMIKSQHYKLPALFGAAKDFSFYGVLDNDVLQAALSTPLNETIDKVAQYEDGLKTSGNDFIVQGTTNVPSLNHDATSSMVALTADGLSLVNRLWSFVSRSSVVGQSVKDWFKVHFGVTPSEDMFDTSVCFARQPNFININSVVSNSDTKSDTSGARLGDLAGQALSNISDRVSFDVPNFGFVFCISGVIPLTRVSGGTQCELYNTRYFDMPFPDFDGLGYETLNNTSFVESYHGVFDRNSSYYSNSGYGYVPRFTSYKMYNNIRSGGFSLPSIQDSYLSYCEDTIVDTRVVDLSPLPTPENLKYFFPWRYSGTNFLSYDRIFYNQFTHDSTIEQYYVDDNFMCQSAFEFNISSYLKPISDSYSIESLGKQLVSVKRQ